MTTAHAFQLTGTLLKKKDGIVRELQAGITVVETPSDSTEKTDFGLIATVNTFDWPKTGRIVWSVQAQAALLKSLTDRAASAQINPFLEVDVTVLDRGKIVKLKITGQGGRRRHRAGYARP